jgi:hypothetical protein
VSLHFPDNESRGGCVAQIISSGGELGRRDKAQEASVAEKSTTIVGIRYSRSPICKYAASNSEVDFLEMTVHSQMKELPVYNLVVSKNGPKFAVAKPPSKKYPNGNLDRESSYINWRGYPWHH